MGIELVVMIAGTVFLLLTVAVVLYAVRLRKSVEIEKMRGSIAASQLARRASSAEELVDGLKFHIDQIETWVQEPLPVTRRATKLDKDAYLLYAEIDYLLDSIEFSSLAETDEAVRKHYCEALLKTADLAIFLGNYADAIRRLKRALKFGENYLVSIGVSPTEIFFALGVAYTQWGHEDMSKSFVEEGIRHFEKTLERNPRLESAKHNIAWSFDELARLTGEEIWYEKAVNAYEELLAVNPQYERARFNLACALRRLGKIEQAFEELERIPGNHDLWDYITSDEDFTDLPLEWRNRLEAMAASKKKQAEVVLPT